jgi:mannosyltransferase
VKSRKGTFVFVRAAARVLTRREDTRFIVCGRVGTGRGRDARYYRAIEEFVKSGGLEDRILFIGEQARMAAVYRELDVVALPSRWDATSRVLLEAMACERPVVATRTGGLPEVLDGGVAGRLVAVDDEADLADEILDLLDSPETARRLAKAGRQRFEQHYTIDKHANAIVEGYKGILG